MRHELDLTSQVEQPQTVPAIPQARNDRPSFDRTPRLDDHVDSFASLRGVTRPALVTTANPRGAPDMNAMDVKFVPVAPAEILPTLQQHISAFPAPIDSFLEDHILASQHYQITLRGQPIGWTAVHGERLLTQFALLPGYKAWGQAIFALVRRLEEVQAAFVPTSDEYFLAHALDDYRQIEKQAYFFQHDPQRPAYQPALTLNHRQATAADRALIQHHSGDFFDRVEQRLAEGQLYITERAGQGGDSCAGFGIIDSGRLALGVASCGMFTVEAQRNQGIGPAIIAHLIARCADRGLRPIAGCWYYNHRSKKTLEKAGMFSQTRLLKISF